MQRMATELLIVVMSLTVVAQASPVETEPALTATQLAALRKRALEDKNGPTVIRAPLVRVLGLGDTELSAKQLLAERPDGKYYVNFCLSSSSDDIIFVLKKPGYNLVYLTDSRLLLRAAARVDSGGVRVVSNGQAAASFEAVLRTWAELSDTLKRP